MKQQISIEKIGIAAFNMLADTEHMPKIHSVFSNAINVIYKRDYIITFLPEGYSAGTQAVVLSKESFNGLKNMKLQLGESMGIAMKASWMKAYIIDLDIPKSLKLSHAGQIINNINACLMEMENKSNQQGLAAYLFHIDNMYTKVLHTHMADIKAIIEQQDYTTLKGSLIGILGLGPGLTPSGDDFIYGFMAALFYYYKFKDFSIQQLSEIMAEVSNEARTKTTIISYNMLRSCISGEFSEYVRALLIGILCSDNVQPLLHRVLQIGSSSGADIAAGILYGMKILFMKEE